MPTPKFTTRTRALGGRPALGVVTLVGRQQLGRRTLPVVEIPAPVLNRLVLMEARAIGFRPGCSPDSSRPEAISPSPCCTPTSTRAPSPCAAKSSVTSSRSQRCHPPVVRGGRQTYEPVNGCHTGMMDLSQVDLPVDATYYRDPAARRAAALTWERRPDRLCWNAGRPDRRVDRLTPTRHRPDTATRRMSLLLPSGTGWE